MADGLGGETENLIDQENPISPIQRQSSASQTKENNVPSSRVDRLLLQRLRKSQSGTALYGDSQQAAEDLQEPSVYQTYENASQQRLIVVANRLPVSAVRERDGSWSLQVSAGGLVSALMGVSNFKTCWIGWPGVYVPEGPERDALTAALAKECYVPVYLDPKIVDLHYNGFCNSVLWQLFHYVPLNMDSKLSETRTLQFQWAAHQSANQRFADVVLRNYSAGDVVWVQDYHLMLLPAMLKNRAPKMKVGWFLHTPFPSSEIYRTLPVREEVLRAVLKADLIGFHTYDYARHFVSACTRILGLEGTPEGVEDNGSLTRVAAFPIGIDPERFARALEKPNVKAHIAQLLNRYAGRKVMLGVDRLDMIKGIPQKLLAFEKFLEEHPQWRDKVLLVQIAVPSRTDVPEYQRLRSMVHEIVGRINGHYGTLTHVPIHHLDRQLAFHELCALYAVTDIALVTSLRDGMNLVSYEYVACQSDNAGVLVLSEFAGAAQSLGAGAILVNPWNITDMAAAIEDALTMSDQERRERHRQNYMHVTIHTSQTWADTFISELNDTHVEAELRTKHIPPQLDTKLAVKHYHQSTRRLLVLGYNATLTTAVEAPRQPKRHFDQIKALTRVNPRVFDSVAALCGSPDTTVVVFSGSDKQKLEETFGELDVWLAAENGIFMRPPGNEWSTLLEVSKKDWMESVQLVFDYFCERTPRSFVELRKTSVVWNYKYADVEFGRLQARDLLQHLWTGPISNAPVDIVQGAKSVEVRPVGISKGLAMSRIINVIAAREAHEAVQYDFVLVAGHFLVRDENIFTFFEGQSLKVAETYTAHHHKDKAATLHVVPEYEDTDDAPTPGSGNDSNSTLPIPRARQAFIPRGSSDGDPPMSVAGQPTHLQLPSPTASSQQLYGSLSKWGGHFLPHFAHATRASSSSDMDGLHSSGSLSNEAPQAAPLDLPPKHLYTCTVGRNRSQARYFLNGSSEVGSLLAELAGFGPQAKQPPAEPPDPDEELEESDND
ncbi:Trehalose-6-P synthase/phosphatase complex synthase subunit [Coccomyxa viridis]|uniref:alpha,alpha-trehalose-phosphate synthase (UDP-forming) n=1 Tax=Coccomyxa viridis TaxID=1274662 RepID=A0AAV1IH48_9CHLO|nr:Trehalose-6-P synthase/phosphatase complex synthase subunit [Coccomyxa viridis]